MDNELFTKTLNSIQEKLGEENSALIADDLGMLMTGQSNALSAQEQAAAERKDLEQRNQKLIASNANLLRQIPVMKESELDPSSSNDVVEKKSFDPASAFDEHGRIIK